MREHDLLVLCARCRFELRGVISEYADMAHFIQGSPMSSDDLKRVNADAASAVFIVQQPFQVVGGGTLVDGLHTITLAPVGTLKQ